MTTLTASFNLFQSMENVKGETTPLFVVHKTDRESSSSSSKLCRSADAFLPWLLRVIAAIGVLLLIYTITAVIRGIDNGGFDLDLANHLIEHAGK